jgi:hypothetical protein
LKGEAARRSEEQSYRRSQIDSQTARADGDRHAEYPERTFRPLMADQRKAALQGKDEQQETMCREIGNGDDCHNQSDWSKRPTIPANNEISWATKIG